MLKGCSFWYSLSCMETLPNNSSYMVFLSTGGLLAIDVPLEGASSEDDKRQALANALGSWYKDPSSPYCFDGIDEVSPDDIVILQKRILTGDIAYKKISPNSIRIEFLITDYLER